MSSFYEKAEIINDLKSKAKLTVGDCTQLLQTIKGDEELTVHFYKANTNPAWIKLLTDAGEFAKLGGSDKEVGICQEAQARYLSAVAAQSPEEVLEVFTSVGEIYRYLRGEFVNALLNMPDDIAVKGVPIVIGYLKGKELKDWYFVCHRAAKLMVKLVVKYPEEAFSIARELLEVWVPENKEGKIIQKEIQAKFRAYEYEEIVFNFYKKLWEADALRAVKLLVGIFKMYLDELQKDKDYEVISLMYITMERLDQIGERFHSDIVASLIGGICEAGKAVIETQLIKTDELLELLRSLNKQIFTRIELYLLKYVPAGSHKARINGIIKDKIIRETTGFNYEYYLLLNDKFDDISDDAKEDFLSWIEERQVPDDDIENFAEWFKKVNGKDYEQEDLLKYEDSLRARKLSLVKERFKEQYEKYRDSSGSNDEELAPKPMVGPARWVDPTEGTPLSVEDMVKMKPEEVIAYIIDENKWKDKKTSIFNAPEEALVSAFRKTVQQQADEYIKLPPSDLLRLNPKFITDYFDGIWTALREKEADSDSWKRILESAKTIIEEKGASEEFEYCFGEILRLIEHKLEQKTTREHHELVWNIIKPLTKYKYNPDHIVMTEAKKDPYDECINCVQGKAFESAIRFGIGCKKELSDYYEKTLSKQLRDIFDFIANENSDAKVVCVFGVWFVQLHWLEEDWVEKNLDLILREEDVKRWDAVWGSYVTWGRPAPKAFNLLAERGKYKNAVERIGETNSFKYRKDIEEGLTEHLMIAFFNKWIEFDNEILNNFFSNASAELRGYAANFLTTGFKHVKEGEEIEKGQKQEYGERLKLYWESRLNEISKAPKENIGETQEFALWVKDSLFSNKESLNLLYKTLVLSNGKLGERVRSIDFIEGVCDATKGNEIKAIQCLKLAFNDPEMREYFQVYKENLDRFFDLIINLPDDYPDIVNIRKEAIDLVDNIGRLCADLRDDYSKLYISLNEKLK
jgi:hypothetical protein